MTTPNSSRWPDLFDAALSIIDHANDAGIGLDDWTFGGGTALMLQIDHRESYDIDLFISDPQYLPYLNPFTQGHKLAIAPCDYTTDGRRTLRIVFADIGEIDFICCPPITAQASMSTTVRNRRVKLETPAEIIAKKVCFRGSRMQPRDMFDIAATVVAFGEDHAVKALSPFRSACQTALITAEAMDAAFARSVMSSLLAHDEFSSLHENAQDITCKVLRRIA